MIPRITDITKITVDNLKNAQSFNNFKEIFLKKIKNCYKPTFIAHNGHTYDHKILRYYSILPYDSNTYDSIQLICNIYNNIGSKKLVDLYSKIMNKPVLNAHRAKDDVLMLIEILNKLDVYRKYDIIKYSNNNIRCPKDLFKQTTIDYYNNKFYKLCDEFEQINNNYRNILAKNQLILKYH
jgi:hypothetical protein